MTTPRAPSAAPMQPAAPMPAWTPRPFAHRGSHRAALRSVRPPTPRVPSAHSAPHAHSLPPRRHFGPAWARGGHHGARCRECV